ncbi:MAG: hypothetical protein H6836_00880 [Planctomycetes bacterium]|nr:hypothetical protein [Planctomycetota bacterium]
MNPGTLLGTVAVLLVAVASFRGPDRSIERVESAAVPQDKVPKGEPKQGKSASDKPTPGRAHAEPSRDPGKPRQEKSAQDKPGKDGPKKPAPATTSPSLPAPPPDRQGTPLPPVLDPPRSAVERRDLLQRFKPRNPIEGFYRVRSMTDGSGGPVAGARGYLVVGRDHLSMHLMAPTSDPKRAVLQSVVRRYRILGDKLVMSSLVGHRSLRNGDIALEKPGTVIERRFQLVGAVLRLFRGNGHVDLVRIE